MVDINYSEAVQALASGINAKSGSLDRNRKIQIARSLMQQEDVESLEEWSEIELSLSDDALKKLRRYSAELHKAYDAEIGKEIHLSIQNARKLSELRTELKKDIDRAMDESHELEKIAERLQDSGLGKVAGKEEHEINELGRKLKKLDEKGQEVDQLEQKLLNTTNKLGIGHGELHQTIEKRSKTVGQLIKKASIDGSSGGSSGSNGGNKGRNWKELLENPGAHIDPKDSLGISKNDLVPYKGSSWCIHPDSDSYSTYKTPAQGFKFHISANPDEAYEVCKELIPILQNQNIAHKIMRDKRQMTDRLGNSYPESVQAFKLMTIYPGVKRSGWNPQEFEVGNPGNNEQDFFVNQAHTEDILNYLVDKTDESILNGGPKIEGKRHFFSVDFPAKEFRVGKTRIHLTYSNVGGGNRHVIKNGDKYSVPDYVLKKDSNGDKIQINHSPYYELNQDNFRESGDYNSNGNYNSSDYFLSHLLSESKAKEVKKGLGGRFGPNKYQDDAIIGLDGKIAGAHYLPPPEGVKRIQQIISNM